MLSKPVDEKQTANTRATWVAALGWIAAWVWTIVAGGGGGWMLWTRGPWPLTNGWFALFSGLSACPATAWVLKKCAGVHISGYVRLAATAFFFVAGRIALAIRS
jgi:hypothetical protein